MGRKPSYLWNYFTIVDRKRSFAKCNICGRNIIYKSTTSNLKKHLNKPSHVQHLKLNSKKETTVESIKVDGFKDGKNNSEEPGQGVKQDNTYQLILDQGDEDPLDISTDALQATSEQESQGIDNLTESDCGGSISDTQEEQKPFPRTCSSSHLKVMRRMTSSTHLTDDFELFGSRIGKQLRKLSKVNSVLAQDEIQAILTKYRIYNMMCATDEDYEAY